MSFSSDVKDELAGIYPKARHCKIAELAGIMGIAGEEGDVISLQSEKDILQRKFFTLLLKAFNIEKGLFPAAPGSGRKKSYRIVLDDEKKVQDVEAAIRHPMLLSMECCRRSFLRGAFLAGGSISDPKKYYHFEIVCSNLAFAETVQNVINSLGYEYEAKTVKRKNTYVVYLKEGEQIVQILGEMGAVKSLMNLVNVRIVREVRGNVNRRVNCETANLNRTAVTAVRQIEDIRYIKEHLGFGILAPPLRQMAEVRLRFPEASLKELGEAMDPVLGKSGVNHRLRKLSEIADKLREEKIQGKSSDPGGEVL